MRALLAVVASLLLFAVAANSALGATVYIENDSTVVSDAELQRELPALQAQVHQDFAPIWGIDADLSLAPAPAGSWVLRVSDNATIQGALGYHDVCTQNGHGTPCGFVFAKTSQEDGATLSVVLDHELLEMLADPYTTTMQKVRSRFYIQEVCDAPESDAYGYTRDGVLLSDFVTPFWFRPGHVGPYDFTGHIMKPLQLLPGGYISWWQNGKWQQSFNHRRAVHAL